MLNAYVGRKYPLQANLDWNSQKMPPVVEIPFWQPLFSNILSLVSTPWMGHCSTGSIQPNQTSPFHNFILFCEEVLNSNCLVQSIAEVLFLAQSTSTKNYQTSNDMSLKHPTNAKHAMLISVYNFKFTELWNM